MFVLQDLEKILKSGVQTLVSHEPCISTIGHGSHVESRTQSFCLCEITLRFSLFAGLEYIDGADSTVSSSLWKMVAFTKANKK